MTGIHTSQFAVKYRKKKTNGFVDKFGIPGKSQNSLTGLVEFFEDAVKFVSKHDLADAVRLGFGMSFENNSPRLLSKMKLL